MNYSFIAFDCAATKLGGQGKRKKNDRCQVSQFSRVFCLGEAESRILG